MVEIRELIIDSLRKAVKKLTGLEASIQLEHPLDEKHGDYSTNIAMTMFNKVSKRKNGTKETKEEWKTPMELAKKIADKFMIHNSKFMILSRVEAVPPGFINFWLSKDYLNTLMIRIIRVGGEYGRLGKLERLGKKIMVEFTDPNPFKEFHIGHLYSNIVGESICRLLESQGAVVKRANYQGDVGIHIAKSLFGLNIVIPNLFRNLEMLKQVQHDTVERKVKLLGKGYAFGSKAYEENPEAKKEIEKINKQIYEKDPAIMPIYEKGRKWSLEYFETIYKRLGTKFDCYYFESEVAETGLKLVKDYLGKGVFQESKGAIVFKAEKFGLHNRVFINSLGLPTYEAKELSLAPTKYKDFRYDQSIIITAQEQSDYFKVVIKALSLINPALGQKTKHIAHGVVRLPIGKMSSRTGTVITGEWLIDEAKRRIITKYKEIDQNTAEKVSVGAVKYALLKSGIGRDIAFSFDESISLEGNSGPYLQYTYARTQSLLRKSQIPNSKSQINTNWKFDIGNLTLEIEEENLLRILHRFPEVAEEASEKFSPNLLCNYLFDLSQKFNLFYQKVPILNPQVSIQIHPKGGHLKETITFRLALTIAVGKVIKNGLSLLGIKAPTKM